MRKLIAFVSLLLLSSSGLRAQLNVYYLNVGQGDATYIELPNGHNVLIDGGPSGTPIAKFLKEKNITRIDHVVLTHPTLRIITTPARKTSAPRETITCASWPPPNPPAPPTLSSRAPTSTGTPA